MTQVIVGTRGTSSLPEYAGSVWVRLQYMLGLERLGIRSYWVDRLQTVNPFRDRRDLEYLTRRFDEIARAFGFGDRYCLVYNDGEDYFGLSEHELRKVVGDTQLLINISGFLPEDSILREIPARAYIDVDPGFTQLWARQTDLHFDRHTHFFTVGQNVGTEAFAVPPDDRSWISILPPIVLDHWPVLTDERCEHFSTVAGWRTKQYADLDGDAFVGKHSEFQKIIGFPEASGQSVELALDIGAWDFADMEMLCTNGWKVVSPYRYAGTPQSYRSYIRHSRGEFGVAKHGYVKSNSGWVSDRTGCYLASGKPVLLESTGFESTLPVGEGLITFRTLEEAVAGVRKINENYLDHCRAARTIAERWFDSDRVLTKILGHTGLASSVQETAGSQGHV